MSKSKAVNKEWYINGLLKSIIFKPLTVSLKIIFNPFLNATQKLSSLEFNTLLT